MDNNIIDILKKIKDEIYKEILSPEILDDKILGEIIDATYGMLSNEKLDSIRRIYINAKNEFEKNNDISGLVFLIDVLIVSIDAIETIQNDWVKKSNSLITSLKNNRVTLHGQPENKKVKMDVGEIFSHQNKSPSEFAYNRLDTIVRYLAIEEYYGKNDYGFYLYRKMQGARMGADYVEQSVDKYKTLIDSFDKNGYSENSCIVCDKNLNLVDGSHRLALGLYHGIDKISIEVLPNKTDIYYGINWFRENGFTNEEIEIICDKCIDLMEQYIVPFTCILWPPVQDYFDEITQVIASEYEVVECNDYEYSEETFERLVRGIYNIDDIEQWKIEKKISYMKQHIPKRVRLLKLYLVGPDFRLKQVNGASISQVGEFIKGVIRNNYKDKIENYFYDIIIHTGDNFKQNRYISKLFNQAFSLRDYLQTIKDYQYIIIKYDVPYQTKDFPSTYAFSKDLDIIVCDSDYEKMIYQTVNYFDNNVYGYEIRSMQCEDNFRVRIELGGYLIFQIDISKGVLGMNKKVISDSIDTRVFKDGFYCANTKYEICYRINALIKAPGKIHHVQYIKEHFDDIEYSIIDKAFEGSDIKKLLSTIL